MAHSAAATGRAAYDANSVAGLARFFPDAMPVRYPVQLTRLVNGASPEDSSESIVVEFGTSRELLFASQAHWEFGDRLRVKNSDGSLDEEVSVVAVQYQPSKTFVAARFKRDVPHWIVKS